MLALDPVRALDPRAGWAAPVLARRPEVDAEPSDFASRSLADASFWIL